MANKAPYLCITGIITLLLVGCGEDKQAASTPAANKQTATQPAPKPEPAKPTVKAVKKEVEKSAEEVADKASQMKDDIKEQASATMTKVEEKANNIAEKVTTAVTPAAPNGESTYKSLCFSCHDTGLAGAPKLGDKGAWAPRLATGVEAIYATALNGKGAMPAKGGNPALSDADVKAAVDYMLSTVN